MKLKILVIFLLALEFVACARPVKTALKEDYLLTEDKLPQQKKQPFSVSVLQAFYVSNKLNVKVLLEANTNYPSNKIVIKLAALKKGEVVEEQLKLVSDLHEESEIKTNQRLIIPFEMQAEDFNEYQIHCSWGNDATILLDHFRKYSEKNNSSETKIDSSAKDLQLEQVELLEKNDNCENPTAKLPKSPPCFHHYSISAALINKSATNLSQIKLAVGIVWAEEGKLPGVFKDFDPLMDSEEALDLEDYVLKASSEKKVKVDIDREVPKLSAGKFFPYIRIVEFKQKKD